MLAVARPARTPGAGPPHRRATMPPIRPRWPPARPFSTAPAPSRPAPAPSPAAAPGPAVLRKSLSAAQDRVLADEIAALQALREVCARLGADPEDVGLLAGGVAQLEQLFLLVVVGEFNAGKSSFINALLGHKWLKDGVTPTTSNITIVRYGERPGAERAAESGFDVVSVPVQWLRDINLVDTPGTNAVLKDHQHITEHFVPRADLVLFVTSTDRAFSESERSFLSLIKQFNKKIVTVLSKADILETPEDLRTVLDFVHRNAKELLHTDPMVFPVSAKLALAAKARLAPDALAADPQWQQSRFGALEHYLLSTLDPPRRARLKLENPLGVAEHVLAKYTQAIAARLDTLQLDLETLRTLEEQKAFFVTDAQEEFKNHMHRIDNVLLKLQERSTAFLDEKVAFTNIVELATTNRLRTQFEEDVVGPAIADIELMLNDVVEWLAAKDRRHLSTLTTLVRAQAARVQSTKIAWVDDQFEDRRRRLLEGIGGSARKIIESYDKKKEAARLSSEVTSALLGMAAMEVGAVTLGGLLGTLLFDLSGLLVGGALAVAGFAFLPYKQRQIKTAMREQLQRVRKELAGTLERHFRSELTHVDQRVEDAVAPYTTFVRGEHKRLQALREELGALRLRLESLRRDLNAHFPEAPGA